MREITRIFVVAAAALFSAVAAAEVQKPGSEPDPAACQTDALVRVAKSAMVKARRTGAGKKARAQAANIRALAHVSRPGKNVGRDGLQPAVGKDHPFHSGQPKEDGTPAGKERPGPVGRVQGWGRNHAVSNYEDEQSCPSIAKDSQGRLYVAYDWLYSGTGKYEVWMARSMDGGNDWEDLFYLGDDNYNYLRPNLAVTSDDQFFLFYQTDDTLGLQYLWSSGGDKWYFDNLLSWQSTYPKCHRPRVASALKNDSARVVVAWEYDYYENGSDYDIGYAYSRDGGMTWLGRPNHIAYSGDSERFPSACLSDSLAAVAYELQFTSAAADSDSTDIMYAKTGGLTAPGDTFPWNAASYGIGTYHHDRFPCLSASGRYLYLGGQKAYNKHTDYDILVRHSKDGGKNFTGSAIYATGTSAEEKYPALTASDTICYLAYSRDSTWVQVSWSADTGKTFAPPEIASDSNTCAGGHSGITVELLTDNPRVAWVDGRNATWGLGTDIYFNTDLRSFPRECDLAPYPLTGWQHPLVPSKLRGTYAVSDTLRGMLTAAADTTFVDLCLIDSASVDVADTFRAGLFVDEWLYAYLEEERLPAWWPTGSIDYPMWVFGGRHTMSLNADYEERILYERTRDNNVFSRQWVWTPYGLPDDTTLQVPTPPVNVVDPAFPDYNCDGYRQSTTNYWSAVGMKPAPGTDYALRVYSDAYGKSEAGFTEVAAESNLGPDTVDLVAINGNRLTSGTSFYPGVYRGPKTGDGDYYLQFCLQDGTTPANGWSTVRRMGEYQVAHTYDVNLSAGTLYYAACSLAAGPANLGFAVFSPKGDVYKPRSSAIGQEPEVTAPGRQFSFTSDTSGWHAVVVWHNTPAKDDTSMFHVGINTVPFGLPLAVGLAYFSASSLGDSVVLSWRTESEEGSYQWLVERAAGQEGFLLLGTLPAAGNNSGPRDYRWCDCGAKPGMLYHYRIGEQALDGTITYYGPIQCRIPASQPEGVRLTAGPNPFGGRLKVAVKVNEEESEALLAIYSISGRRVRTLLKGEIVAGDHTVIWDGNDEKGNNMPAGCYLLRWEAGGEAGTKRLIKVR
jgi:hypothetical protein